jgi:protein-L-isoaspartate(D-aspartate) O-methyltransferase
MELALRRRFFAEEIEAVAKLRSRTLVEALEAVPREQFLPPGPWTVMADADFTGMSPSKTRQTPDADSARVYHNIGVAIDAERQLFNGQPAGALSPRPGRFPNRRACAAGRWAASGSARA